MFKTKALTKALATALIAGTGFSGAAHAVQISPTTVGQVLMGEMYLARATDYKETTVQFVNTSLTNAVKARIAFRSKKHSDECADLVAYLSPGDVAYLKVRLNAAGKPELWSDDDSFLATRDSAGNLKFASQMAGGQSYVMKDPRTEPKDDSCAQGHVEVIGVYAAQGTVAVGAGNPVVVRQGMSKFDLIRIFDTPKADLNAKNTGLQVTNNPTNGADATARIRLKGDVTMASATDRIRVGMTALDSGGASGHLITSPTLDTDVGAELLIGAGFYAPAGANLTGDALNDIDAALNTNVLFNSYVKGGTTFQATFPTKYRKIATGRYSGNGATYNPPYFPDGSVRYTATLFDNQENFAPVSISPICIVSPCDVATTVSNYLIHEVNYVALTGTKDWDPASGWFNLGLFGVSNAAVPAIGWAHHFGVAGTMNSVTNTMGR